MSDFRQISPELLASPQIGPADLAEAAALGVTLVINNRPDGESEDQPSGAEIAAAAEALGMDYIAIPVTHAGFSAPQVASMREALDRANGPVLAYCRSGTRSTFLWALAEASRGADIEATVEAAARAGYDLGSIRPLLLSLAGDGTG